MTMPSSPLAEIENTIRNGSSEQRSAMLRRITDLFLDSAPYATEAEAALFDDVFERLIDRIERKAMRELSQRLARLENAPVRLIRRLAHDDEIEVSEPVLSHSPRLGEEDLVAVARSKSQAHLAAIAGRATLAESVTDILVDRGDAIVVRKVAANAGARFTETSMGALIDRTDADDELAQAIARRKELSPAMFRRLLARATEHVRTRLMQEAQPGAAEAVSAIVAQVSRDVEAVAAPKRDYATARQNVADMRHLPALNILQCASSRKMKELAVALAEAARVPLDVIDRFLDDPSDDPIMLVCKALDLDWATAFAVLAAKRGDLEINEASADDAHRRYRNLSTYSAQRVVRFWQARGKIANAG